MQGGYQFPSFFPPFLPPFLTLFAVALFYTFLPYTSGVAVVEHRSLTGELSLSCARPAADG